MIGAASSILWPAIYKNRGGGGSEYVGPLDLLPDAKVAYSNRALSAAKRGSSLYTIMRDSDAQSQSFNSDAVTGNAPSAAMTTFIGGTFQRSGVGLDTTQILLDDATGVRPGQSVAGLGVPDGTIVTNVDIAPAIIVSQSVSNEGPTNYTFNQYGRMVLWNDQSTNGVDTPFVQLSTNISAYWEADAINGKPVCNQQQSDTQADIVSVFSSGAVSFFIVARGTVTMGFYPNAGAQTIDMEVGQGMYVYYADADGNSAGGDFSNALSNNNYYIWDGAIQFGSKSVKDNGTELALQDDYDTGGPLSPLADCFFVIGGYGTDILPSIVVEIIYYDALLSDANRLAVRQNIANYYGITLS